MAYTLNDALFSNTVPFLKKLASLIAEKPPTRKAELVAVLKETLLNKKNLLEIWEELDVLQKAAVAEALYSFDLSFDSKQFEAKYGRLPVWGSRSEYDKEKPQHIGLFIHHRRIPSNMEKMLKSFVPEPEAPMVMSHEVQPETHTIPAEGYHPEQANIPVTICETERAALHDAPAVLRLIDEKRISVSDKTKRPGKSAQRGIAEMLYGGDFYPEEQPKDKYQQLVGNIKAFAWPLLMQAAQFSELAGKYLRLTPSGEKALSAPPADAIRSLWASWLKSSILDEMNRVEAIQGQSGKGKRNLTSTRDRRDLIVYALCDCPLGSWITIEEFSRYMRACGYELEITRDAWSLYIGSRQYGSLGYKGFGELVSGLVWQVANEEPAENSPRHPGQTSLLKDDANIFYKLFFFKLWILRRHLASIRTVLFNNYNTYYIYCQY